MAKGNTGAEDHAKVKVRVTEFELEGGNATVENSIRQLTTALTNYAQFRAKAHCTAQEQ